VQLLLMMMTLDLQAWRNGCRQLEMTMKHQKWQQQQQLLQHRRLVCKQLLLQVLLQQQQLLQRLMTWLMVLLKLWL
jgi:hypothetical protein